MAKELCRCVYRARPSVHRGLVEGLSHGEGDLGGAHAGGGLDVEGFPLLADLHRGAGRCGHCDLPHKDVDT